MLDIKLIRDQPDLVRAAIRDKVPLLENHQREDGSVAVPPALRPYLGDRASLP